MEMDEFANDVYQKVRSVMQDKSEYIAQIRAEKAEYDRKAQLEYATEYGEEKGKKEGKREGIKEGVKIGRKEGREEEKIEIAIKLKKLGIPLKQIAESTGLTLEEIKKL